MELSCGNDAGLCLESQNNAIAALQNIECDSHYRKVAQEITGSLSKGARRIAADADSIGAHWKALGDLLPLEFSLPSTQHNVTRPDLWFPDIDTHDLWVMIGGIVRLRTIALRLSE